MAGDQLVAGTATAHNDGPQQPMGSQALSKLVDTVQVLVWIARVGLDGRDW